MPYKSDAQRRFFHTNTAKKAGITEDEVKEFDQASKGKKLPEKAPKNMAYGGETNPKHETVKSMENNPTAGFAAGGEVKPTIGDENPVLAWLRTKLIANNAPIVQNQNAMDQIDALEKGPQPSTGTVTTPNMADGGDISDALSQLASPFKPLMAPAQMTGQIAANPTVQNAVGQMGNAIIPGANPFPQPPPMPSTNPNVDQDFINQLNRGISTSPAPTTPVPTAPPLSHAVQQAQNMPSTPPSIYQGVTADDRANLYKQLLAQKSSPGMLAASGAAGLGDAITSAFGKSPTNTQQNLRQAANQNVEQRIGAVDTQRQQKLQDLQANMAVLEADPNSAYSQGMRQFFNSNGIKAPSGMSAGMLKGLLPDMAKIFETRTTAATAAGAQGVEAGKALMGESLWDKVKEELGFAGPAEGEAGLEKAVGKAFPGAAPSKPSMSGWSIKR